MTLLLLGGLLACQGDKPASDSAAPDGKAGAVPVAVQPDEEANHAPAFVLLAELGADGHATVGGTVMGELWVDLDEVDDERWPFRYQVLDASSQVLFERTVPGPIQVVDYLGHYSEATDYEILAVFPFLGDFPLLVPLLDGGVRVRLQTRAEDGSYVNVGSYNIADAADDDQGLSDAVVGATMLWDSGPSENRLDLVLIPDGYTAEQQDQWAEDADRVVDAFLAQEPFSTFSPYINIHRVDALSAESGASFDCTDECRVRDTAFGTIFPMNWVNALIGTDFDTRAVFQMYQWEVARAVSVVPWDAVLVVSNSQKYGGMSVHYATVTNAESTWANTSVHELGHGIGLLGDEYQSDDCIVGRTASLPPNITDDGADPPWGVWIEDGTPLPTPSTSEYADVVGAFEGAYNCDDLYRPARTCLMKNSDGGPFCSVCAEQVARRIFRFADPADALDWSQDEDGLSLTVDAPLEGLSLEVRSGDALLASGSADETLLVPTSALRGRAGEQLTVTVSVETAYVREQDGELSQSWQILLQDPPG